MNNLYSFSMLPAQRYPHLIVNKTFDRSMAFVKTTDRTLSFLYPRSDSRIKSNAL